MTGPTDRPDGAGPLMYDELAGWFHLLTPPADYEEEAADILRHLREHVDGELATLLELGSGGGHTASHLRAHLQLTLADRSPAMLDASRELNPGCEHLVGDMRTLRLGRVFDAVLIHDAIDYMTTEADLRAALATAFVHLRPGGAAVFVPDHVRETWAPRTDHGGSDGPQRSLRYLEWETDPDPADTTTMVDFAILLRETDGTVRVRHDRHVVGLFPRATWLRLLREVGFEPAVEADAWTRDLFVGRRPAGPVLRRAAAADVPGIDRVVDAAYAHYAPLIGRTPLPMLADHAAAVRDEEVWVLEEDGAVAGVIELVPRPDHLWVENVAIDPGRQGRGLGRRLLGHAEDEARRRGLAEIRLLTNERYATNIAMYRRYGYEETHREPYLGTDLVHFRKRLAAAPG